MTKIALILFLLGLGASSLGLAKTQIFIQGDSATILLQGPDSDAKRFFDSIKQSPILDGNILKKEISFYVVGDEAFKIACSISRLSSAGSCSLFFTAQVASIDQNSKSVLLGINDQFDAPRFASNFHDDGDRFRPLVFQSEDSKLQIWKTNDSVGKVVSFTLTYR